jgi:hypothetical protein
MDEYTGTYFDQRENRYVSLEYSYIMKTVIVSDYYTDEVIEEVSSAFFDKSDLAEVPEQVLQETRKLIDGPQKQTFETEDGEANPEYQFAQSNVSFEEAKRIA